MSDNGVEISVRDSEGREKVNTEVTSSVLPTGAANATNQATMITALQLIDDLRAALQSVATDRLIVRGDDQLFSFKERLISRREAVISGAAGFVDSNSPAAGQIWVVTNVGAADLTTATTEHRFYQRDGGLEACIHRQTEAFGLNGNSHWHGHIYLKEDDEVRVFFAGALAGDTCRVDLTGYIMTLET